VLTLPLFVMVMLLIVQVSQLMVGTVVVHYAAFAAAAARWSGFLPTWAAEQANCASSYFVDPEADNQVVPLLDHKTRYGPGSGGLTFVVAPGSAKYEKIASRPSWLHADLPLAERRPQPDRTHEHGRDISSGPTAPWPPNRAATPRFPPGWRTSWPTPSRTRDRDSILPQQQRTAAGNVPGSPGYRRILLQRDRLAGSSHVTVKHNLALLPGPGRLLARGAPGSAGAPDEVSRRIERQATCMYIP